MLGEIKLSMLNCRKLNRLVLGRIPPAHALHHRGSSGSALPFLCLGGIIKPHRFKRKKKIS